MSKQKRSLLGAIFAEGIRKAAFDLYHLSLSVTAGEHYLRAHVTKTGWSLTIRLKQPAYEGGWDEIHKYVKVQDPSREDLVRHANYMVTAELNRRGLPSLIRQREAVYAKAEARDVDAEQATLVAEGRTHDYCDMTSADCEFWLKWLDTQPLKGTT